MPSDDTAPRWLDYVPVDDLPDDPRNPKAHADADIDASMERFGYTEPILVDERTGLLVAGHGRKGRLIAQRDAGAEAPEGIVVDPTGQWTVPVVRGWASKDDEHAAAYLIASNRLTEKGGWLNDPLVAILAELRDGPGLDGTGYSSDDLDDLLATIGPAPTLEDLAAKHGEDQGDDFWPTLRFKVSPDTKARYEAVTGHLGANDTEHFEYLLRSAEERHAATKQVEGAPTT